MTAPASDKTTAAPLGATSEIKLSLLFDTNVWIDFFLDRSRNHEIAVELVTLAHRTETPIFTSIETTKDTYFIVASELKRMQREQTGALTEQFAQAVNEVAWSCLSLLRRQSTIVGADASDMIEAMVQRSAHGDYEDNLVIAAAMRANATHIVSSDQKLQQHSPIPCISIGEALKLIAERSS